MSHWDDRDEESDHVRRPTEEEYHEEFNHDVEDDHGVGDDARYREGSLDDVESFASKSEDEDHIIEEGERNHHEEESHDHDEENKDPHVEAGEDNVDRNFGSRDHDALQDASIMDDRRKSRDNEDEGFTEHMLINFFVGLGCCFAIVFAIAFLIGFAVSRH